MDIILIPGLWLDASSWDDVIPALEEAGHAVHPLTMPGVGVPAPASSEIGIADWVDAVVAEIDAIDDQVVVVGHSGGGNVAWGAADARPERVARVIFVDTVPPPDGHGIWEFELEDGVVPFPGWESFDDAEVFDLDADARASARLASVPARVPTDAIRLRDERRRRVPVTLLSGGMSEDEFRAAAAQWGEFGDEFTAIERAEVVKLNSGHWPQFSQPAALGQAIAAAVSR